MTQAVPPRWQIMLAFAALYVVWGSTYLAMRYTAETLPPFLMSVMRFLLAGVILMVWARRRGAPMPTLANWRAAAVSGGLLFVVGNGGVAWSVQYVPSSIAALMTAMMPLWMVLLNWGFYSHERPNPLVFVGLMLGFSGILLLINPDQSAAGEAFYWPAMLLMTITPLAWAMGSLHSRLSSLPSSPRMTTGIQLVAGGALTIPLAALAGDFAAFDISQVSLVSWGAFWYLVVMSSLVTFLAYVWLLRVADPARVATYAFVNPVVALFLGVMLAGEPLTPRTMIAAAVILAGVVIITLYSQQRAPVRPPVGVAAKP